MKQLFSKQREGKKRSFHRDLLSPKKPIFYFKDSEETHCWPPPGNEMKDVSRGRWLVQVKARAWIITRTTPAESGGGGHGGNHCLSPFAVVTGSAVPRPSLKSSCLQATSPCIFTASSFLCPLHQLSEAQTVPIHPLHWWHTEMPKRIGYAQVMRSEETRREPRWTQLPTCNQQGWCGKCALYLLSSLHPEHCSLQQYQPDLSPLLTAHIQRDT